MLPSVFLLLSIALPVTAGPACSWNSVDGQAAGFDCRAANFGTIGDYHADVPLVFAVPPDACGTSVTCEGGCEGKIVLAVRGRCPFYQKALAVMHASEGKATALIIADSEPHVPGKPPLLLVRGQSTADPTETLHSIPVFSTYYHSYQTITQAVTTGAVRVSFGDPSRSAQQCDREHSPPGGDNQAYTRLTKWVAAAASGKSAVKFVAHDGYIGPGAVATRRLAVGEPVVYLHGSLVLNVETAKARLDDAVNAALATIAAATSPLAALAVLLMWMLDPANRAHKLVQDFEPWLNVLPRSSDWFLPQWTSAELAELQGTLVLADARAGYQQEWEIVTASAGALFSDKSYATFPNYLHARCVVLGRCFEVMPPLTLPRCLPAIDMLNHAPQAQQHVSRVMSTTEGNVLQVAVDVIESGDPVLQSYFGAGGTNADALQRNAFVSPDNFDEFSLRVQVPDAARHDQLEALRAHLGEAPSRTYGFKVESFSVGSCGVPREFLEAVRVLLSDETQLLQAFTGQPGSIQFEYNVFGTLLAGLESELRSHPTTAEQDRALLAGESALPRNVRTAARFRLGVKRLKQQTLEHAQATLALLAQAAEDADAEGAGAQVPAALVPRLMGCTGHWVTRAQAAQGGSRLAPPGWEKA